MGYKREKGVSLIEITLAVVIGVIVIIGILTGYGAQSEAARYNNAKSIVDTVRTAIQTQRSSTGSCPTLAQLGNNLMSNGNPFYGTNGANQGDCNRNGTIDAGTEHRMPCDPYTRNSLIQSYIPTTLNPFVPANPANGGWLYDDSSISPTYCLFWMDLNEAQYGRSGTVKKFVENLSEW